MNMMEKTISIVGKQCFGCAGCMSICPKNCIQMMYNEEGFLYPSVEHGIDSFPTDYYQALLHNSAYLKSVKRPIERDSFYRDLHTIKWKEFIHKYMYESVLLSFKRGLKKRIKTLKNYLK